MVVPPIDRFSVMCLGFLWNWSDIIRVINRPSSIHNFRCVSVDGYKGLDSTRLGYPLAKLSCGTTQQMTFADPITRTGTDRVYIRTYLIYKRMGLCISPDVYQKKTMRTKNS